MDHLLLDCYLLLLLMTANGAPILARRVLGERGAFPVDGGRRAPDGRPWFGPSKTWRGLGVAVLSTPPMALFLGLDGGTGLLIAVGAMAGDLSSSFLKRRLAIAPSDQALGLDQIPESLLPLLLVGPALGLDLLDILVLVGVFIVLELLLSRVLYALHIRKRPY